MLYLFDSRGFVSRGTKVRLIPFPLLLESTHSDSFNELERLGDLESQKGGHFTHIL